MIRRGDSNTGIHLKSTSGWNGENGFDTYGFDGKPCGYYSPADSRVYYGGYGGRFWSATPDGTSSAYYRRLDCSDGSFCEYCNGRFYGISVRLLKDSA